MKYYFAWFYLNFTITCTVYTVKLTKIDFNILWLYDISYFNKFIFNYNI